jgi:hypothetical protein
MLGRFQQSRRPQAQSAAWALALLELWLFAALRWAMADPAGRQRHLDTL